MQITVTAGTAPAGDPSGPLNDAAAVANVAGTFTLWYDANGNGVIDANELLTVNYDESDPSAAAQQIQTWLHGFTPVYGVSDAQYATVNAIDPHTFVIDFGAATQGLDQSGATPGKRNCNTSVPPPPCRSATRCNSNWPLISRTALPATARSSCKWDRS